MDKLVFRAMNMHDINSVFRIETLSFQTPWSLDSFQKELEENKLAKYYVVEIEGTIVAYGGMWIIVDEAHVTNIAVDPNYRGKGIGDYLVDGMVEAAKSHGAYSMTLEVRVSNDTAINLYKKHGFESVGVRPNYYQENNEDALIMWKNF